MNSPTERLQRTISRLPLTASGEGYSYLHPDASDWQVDQHLNPANLLYALHLASDARGLAVSHRRFDVASAIFAYNQSPNRYQFLTGVNIKPEPETEVNIHAEQQAFQMARDRGFAAVRFVVVVGETQNDTQSGHTMCTLHPCGLCRNFMEESPMVDNTNTLIVSALPDLRTLELFNINRLKRYHEDKDFEAGMRIDVPDLDLLKAAAIGNPVKLVDTDKDVKENRVWTNLIFTALQEFREQNKLES